MAKQIGLIKVKGTLDDVTFYQTKDGNRVKMKTNIEAERIANDPAYARTRENNAEFGQAAKAGKLLRATLRPLFADMINGGIAGRITKIMSDIKKEDLVNVRGTRNVGTGIGTANGKAKLRGIDFNEEALLGSILFKPYVLTPGTGVVTITGLLPSSDVLAPRGASHFSLSCGFANINFVSGVADLKLSNVVNLSLSAAATTVTLTPTAVPSGSGTKVYLLRIEFFQLVNGVQYPMKNGAFNALQIIEVA